MAANEFLQGVLNHKGRGGGYGRINITPYIHIFVAHVPEIMAHMKVQLCRISCMFVC